MPFAFYPQTTKAHITESKYTRNFRKITNYANQNIDILSILGLFRKTGRQLQINDLLQREVFFDVHRMVSIKKILYRHHFKRSIFELTTLQIIYPACRKILRVSNFITLFLDDTGIPRDFNRILFPIILVTSFFEK